MNIVDELVNRKIADNAFHASGMLNVLECGKLATDEERIARCELYKAWKQAGENKPAARMKAIAGELPPLMLEDFGKQLAAQNASDNEVNT
jgi:hypothetical protein